MGGPNEVRVIKAFLKADPIGVSREDAFGRSECWYRYILGLADCHMCQISDPVIPSLSFTSYI